MMRVLKYGTGDTIPNGAQYLCTQVETVASDYEYQAGDASKAIRRTAIKNQYVWHYFLVDSEG
jgi:hypothetical protein